MIKDGRVGTKGPGEALAIAIKHTTEFGMAGTSATAGRCVALVAPRARQGRP